jgi:hypothetical protein
MHRIRHALAALIATSMFASAATSASEPPAASLEDTIAALDTSVFDAFNRCADAAELERHAGYFDEGVEFYHDTGGVTWNRADMLANTRKHACGNYTRELIAGSLRVYPIKDFGAIAQGSHRFCQTTTGKCEGLADFTIVWRHTNDHWLITRVMSYGHRAANGGH